MRPSKLITERLCLRIAVLAGLLSVHLREATSQTSAEEVQLRFSDFHAQLETVNDSTKRNSMVQTFLENVRLSRKVIIEDSTIYFVYQGNARRVAVPGDINGWSTTTDTMTRISKTDLFYLAKKVHPKSRFEYKLNVDSAWILDPLNPRQAVGGYGANSEIWMPLYHPPDEVIFREGIAHGRIDTLGITSKRLQRTHPVFVYLPPSYRKFPQKRYPSIYVTDGGEYLSLASMKNVLDNLIADRRIQPVIAVFVDPRTDINDVRTSKRMQDYTMRDSFVTFIIEEVRGQLLRKYKMNRRPELTAIMGASLGGLISTYAAFTRPDVFGLAAAQSPAFWWRNDSLITMINSSPRKHVKFYIDTGTIRDTQEKASEMASVMSAKGYQVHYEEHPEGHNWINWRSRISHILTYFFGMQ